MAGEETSKNKNDGEVIDHTSPLYLHASDYPKQLHVNDLLTDHNYNDWVAEMMNFLFAKNKIGFINGTIKKPEEGSAQHMPWLRCDAMIKGWLTTAMEKKIRCSVKYAKTATEIWNDLHERFGKESAPKAYELKRSLATTRQHGLTVSAYFTKLRSIWVEMESAMATPCCSCNGCTCKLEKRIADLKEKEMVYEFLLGLDDQYGVIKTQILAMKPTPSLNAAYQLVLGDEQQRSINNGKRSTQDAAAFQTSYQGRREGSRNQQDKIWQKTEKFSTSDKNDHCTHCGRDGHNKDGCFKIIGYPEWWLGKGKNEKDKTKRKAAMVGTESIAAQVQYRA